MRMDLLHRAEKQGSKFQNPVPTTMAGMTTIFKVLPKMLAQKGKGMPARQLGPFRTDASVYATPPASGLSTLR